MSGGRKEGKRRLAADSEGSRNGTVTKTKSRKPGRRWLIVGAGAAALLVFGLLERRWWTLNDITTGQTPEYPDLPSHFYAGDARTARLAAEAACAALHRWRMLPSPAAEAAPPIEVEVRTAVFNFTDDVTIRFEPVELDAGAGPRTRVAIRSRSRVGKGDLGENERHIRALQREMDARLTLASLPK